MKKTLRSLIYPRLFIVSLLTLLVTTIKAQVSSYTYLSSTGTYAPITGTDLFGTTWDNNISAPLPLGFNFVFNATTYSSITVSANGFITLGATAPTATNYAPIANAGAYAGSVAGFAKDLVNNGGATTGISYTTTGTAPNRKCTVQWTNATRTGVTGDNVNFQIVLNETSNQIDVIYGTCGASSASNTNKVQVGLRGATNADFNNLFGGNNVAWTAFTAGTTNADNVNYKSSVLPATGLTFSWKVTTCFPPTGISVSGITSSTATFSWTSGATAFDLYYGPTPLTAPTATTVPTASTTATSYPATGLTSGSNYRLYVRTNCGAGDLSAWSAVTTFSTACGIANVPYTQNFQSVTVPAIPLCTSVENVGLGNIWQTQTGGSSFTTKVLYYTYSSTDPADTWYYLQALNLTGGVSYRLTYQYENSSATTYPERMNVSYGSAANSAAMTHTLTDHPNIVNDVANTQVVDFTPATTGVYYIGFHAYSMADQDQLYLDNITVDLSPTCLDPGSLTITGVGTTTASASWTPAGVATVWDLYYGPSPLTPPTAGTAPTATSSATSYTISGLTSGTNYDLYVRSHCSPTDQSTWTPLATFLTPCTPTVIPYSQDFQAVTIPAIPVCNSVENVGTGNVWKTVASPGSGFTSNTLVYPYNSLSSANTWFYIRGLNLTAGTSYRLTYRYGNNGSTTYPENLNVSYGTSPTAAAMTHTLTDHFNLTNSSPITKIVDFTPAATGVYYIGFHAYSDPDQNQLYVDDITVDLSPSCTEPVNAITGALTPTTAVIGWTPAGSETAWDIYYGPSPLTPPTAGTVPTATSSTTSYTVTGLTPSMGYVYYVRAHCSAIDQSLWVGPNSFFTPCLPPSITSTIPSSRCGIGTTTLGATSAGTLNWYAAATGGTAIGTGSVFTTPVINTTTNYYVSSQSGLSTVAGGLLSPTPATTVSLSPSFEGLYFDIAQTCTLVSLDVYPDGASDDIEIDLYDNNYNFIDSYTTTMPAGNGTTALTLPLNFALPVGTDYHMEVYTYNGTSLIANSGGLSYPYGVGPGSITSGFDGSGGVDAGNYFYLYNLKIASICEGPRVAVTATVTPPPALSITSGTTVCANVISTLNITSTLSDFDSYVWTPNTNLYTNAGATTAYTGGTATTVYYKSATAGTTIYTVSANNSSNCANIATTTMVTDVPFISTSATPSVACSGSTISLNAISVAATASVAPSGPASGFSDYTGGPYRSGAGSDYKAQWLFTAAELTSAGFATGNITSLAFNVTSLGGGVMPNYTIRIGNSASTGLTTTFDATPANLVFGPTPYTAVAGMNTHTFSTPFYWDGVSNIVVQVCHDAVSVGSSSVDRESISNRTIYATTSAACGVTTGTSESNRPVIRFAGQVGTNVTASRNFVWNPGAIPTNTAVVNPVNAGSTPAYPVYTVAVTNPVTTCSNTAMVTLTINPIPTVLASASSPSLCSGTTASLTASGATTYSWMPAGGTSSVAVVSPAANTVYTVTGTALGCSSTKTVNLNVTPTPTLAAFAPTVTCSGSPIGLTSSGATNYTWSPIGVMTASTVVSPTVTTTYTLTGESSGCSTTKTLTVIVNNVPTVTLTTNPGSSVLCTAGASATLTATGTSTAYAWSNGPTTATTVVTPSVTSSYTFTGTNSCGTRTAVATVSVGTTPTITAASSATLICANNAVVLTANGTSGITYSWNTGATTTSISVTPTTTTVYTVTGTNSCGTATAVISQSVSPCTGIEEVYGTTGISIYPNPANDHVNIEISSSLVSNHTIVEITDALGKLVMRETLVADVTALNITKLEEGVYFFKVITNNQTVKVGKVVKQQ